MLRFTAAAVCVLFTLCATGQHRKYTVVLNDGSRISGTIVGDSSGYLDIKVVTPQIIRIGKSQVSSVEAVKYSVKKSRQTNGYYIRFSTGILAGNNESNNLRNLSFHISNGYQFKNGLGIGIGSGVEELGLVIVPLYADIRFTPLNTGISPFVWLKPGYGFVSFNGNGIYESYSSSGSKYEGGLFFSTGAGLSLFTRQRTAITIGIGYRYQKITLCEDLYWWGNGSVRETVTRFNRLELQLGFIFM
jgi:hypothetical protein